MYKELVMYITKNLVENTENVLITEEVKEDKTIFLKVIVDKADMGRMIGKDGRIIRAIRVLTTSYANKNGERVMVDVLEKKEA